MTLKVTSAERSWQVLRAGARNLPKRPNIGQPEHYDSHGNIQSAELGSTSSMEVGESRLSAPRTSPRSIAGSTAWVPLPVGLPGLQYADRADNLGAFLPLKAESRTLEPSEMLALQQATTSTDRSTEQTEDTALRLGTMEQDAAISGSKMKNKPKASLQSLPGSLYRTAEIAKQKWKPTKMNATRRDAAESALGIIPCGNREGSRGAPLLDGIRGLSNSTAHGKIENDENSKGHMAEQQPESKDKKSGNHTGLSNKHMSNMKSGSSIPSIPFASLTKEQLESQCLELRVEVLGLKMQLLEKAEMELASHNAVSEAHVSELGKNLQTQDWMIKGKRRKHKMVHDAAEQHQAKLDDVRYRPLRESKIKQAKKAKEEKSSKKHQKETITITGKDTALRMFFYTVVFMAMGIIMFPIVMLLMLFTN
ncbi:hypothetical protein F4813DRAFT_397401 [Daldinia decipiens]|uniref:uncharacterized protein n=1 Tax=Daldinia decipiens TaxID=326647 RepID=UPI0020C24E30|nr:uncharacterized protein F4813DRAFT_397401 [Daldinia decipiens]KAI1656517.1 hypothetical protein F4813DRAFT_397401 [Daldinia decipiens]